MRSTVVARNLSGKIADGNGKTRERAHARGVGVWTGVGKSEIEHGAWMTTLNVPVGGVVVKLWPDTLLFYGLLEIILLGSVLAAEVRQAGKARDRAVWGVKVGCIRCLSDARCDSSAYDLSA